MRVSGANGIHACGLAIPSFTGTYTGAVGSDSFTVSGSSVATTSSPVGTYAIVPGSAGNTPANYTHLYVNCTLIVGQAILTVTATNASRAYGVANPGFTGTYTGAANGDIFTVSGSSVATTSSPVGSSAERPVGKGSRSR